MNPKAESCVANFLNGNLSDAKKQAERISVRDLFDGFIVRGYSHRKSRLTVLYLKHPSQLSYEMACEAK